MNKDNFVQLFASHPKLAATQKILANNQWISWKNLKGSSFTLMSLLCVATTNKKALIVVDEKEEALQVQNELETYTGKNRVFFFPPGYKRSVAFGQPSPENSMLRTEALNHFFDEQHQQTILVTYPAALAEKVFNPEQLGINTTTVTQGRTLSPESLQDVFIDYGFELVDFVYQPGQYAVRGSIIDVFSFASDLPYRIDFFGDEVETIRTFDIETQLSVDQLNEIRVVPDLNNSQQVNRKSIFRLLNESHLLIYRNAARLHHMLEQTIATAQQNSKMLTDELQVNLDQIIISKEDAGVEPGTCFFIQGGKPINPEIPEITFDTSLQPAFQKNFKLVSENLIRNQESGYQNIIVSTQESQIERLTHIFREIDKGGEFTPLIGRLHRGFIDHDLKVACYTDHQIFDRYQRFYINQRFKKKDALSLQELTDLHIGDYVVHIDHGVGQFGGLQKIDINGRPQEAVKLIYRDDDVLFVNIHSLHRISKYKGKDNTPPRLHKLGSPVWSKLKSKTKSKVKDIARDLIQLYAARRKKRGHAFSADSFLNEQLEASFIYEDTPDQLKATQNVKADMEQDIPMDRLICGDVGFGKTEIAIRAAFKAVCDNKQVAVLVPTTILAFQHYKTFSDRLRDFPVRIEYLSRMRSAKDQREIVKDLTAGKIDIIIGTHRLVGKDIQFKDLGLLVNDEEQKFGVSTKEKIRALKADVDTLTMTATPIPRTLQFSLMGARDLSIINTPPPNRYPITTELHPFNKDVIKEAIDYEVSRGGQAFFISNRVQNIHEVEALIQRLCPGVSTIHAHGQMDGKRLEKIMLDFIDQKFDVLVSTTIVESGLDIPNVNTIIINDAQNFGLSDLHQLRGRVGRSNRKAFCYLLTPPESTLTSEAKRRLQAIEMFSELGSGFNIAMQDLDIRGAGNLLGAEQSGFIADVGLETYQQILEEAMFELKEDEFSTLFSHEKERKQTDAKDWIRDCHIDTDLDVRFPDTYIANVSERIRLYKELDTIESEDQLPQFEQRLVDRFGKLPRQVKDLFDVVRLRMIAKRIGVEKIVIKNSRMHAWFISDRNSPFYQSDMFMQILQRLAQDQTIGNIEEKNGKLKLKSHDITDVQSSLKKIKKIM
ncbi:MAG: transcription-repair coupling factor [Salinivirgaceae bacterium]